MNILGLSITRARGAAPARRPPSGVVEKRFQIPLYPLSSRGGWWSIVKEPFLGAWQSNQDIRLDSVLVYAAVFACATLIAADIGKLTLRLVRKDDDGIWAEVENPAFSPVLRRPNHFQTITKFVEQWIISKLIHGNTYVLKQRDARGVVTALYVLDPTRVTPMVAVDGSIYYDLRRDDLSQMPQEQFIVPAREIIHDTMVALYHPLIGVSPIYACGVAAMQGLAIQNNSYKFFHNGSSPGGVLSAPGAISEETADRLKAYWEENYTGDNIGKVAVLGDGLAYQNLSVNAVDAQLIAQLKWTGETVCTCFHVPPYMVGIGPPPPYANVEPMLQQYYSQCLQSLLNNFERHLDEGLGLTERISGNLYGTEFDINDLIWMDTATKTKAAADSIGSGGMSVNEARKRYYALPPVEGGDTPYMQQQNYSLDALNRRDEQQGAPPTTPVPAAPSDDPDEEEDEETTAAKVARLVRARMIANGLVGGAATPSPFRQGRARQRQLGPHQRVATGRSRRQ